MWQEKLRISNDCTYTLMTVSVQIIRRDYSKRNFALVIESPWSVDDGFHRVSDVTVCMFEAAWYIVG